MRILSTRHGSAIALGMAMLMLNGCVTPERSACVHSQLGLVLVDRSVRDCGLLSVPADPRAWKSAQSCAQRALASRAPVRFGSGWVGSDAASCSVVVRDSTGQIWAIQNSYDISVEPGERLYVGRCSHVTFPDPETSPWQHFDVDGCTADPDGFNRVSASLHDLE
jgi:hypothetical protein